MSDCSRINFGASAGFDINAVFGTTPHHRRR